MNIYYIYMIWYCIYWGGEFTIYLQIHFSSILHYFHIALIVKIKKGEIVNFIYSFDFDLINANLCNINYFTSVVFQFIKSKENKTNQSKTRPCLLNTTVFRSIFQSNKNGAKSNSWTFWIEVKHGRVSSTWPCFKGTNWAKRISKFRTKHVLKTRSSFFATASKIRRNTGVFYKHGRVSKVFNKILRRSTCWLWRFWR